MALIVQKFGGTSVGSIDRIEAVARRVINAHQQGHQVVVVVSAMSGETNRLLGLAKQIDEVPMARELDVLLSAGEQVSMALLAMAINKQGFAATSMTADQVGITTRGGFNNAEIDKISTESIQSLLDNGHIVIVAGFQGRDNQGNITTLGRGGSDASAVALASALKADECQIFTDVDGVYTTDPRIEPQARRLDVVDFETMTTLARLGAKVLQLQSVEYAYQHQVPLRVLSSFEDDRTTQGTLVQMKSDNQTSIAGIAVLANQHLFSLASQAEKMIWQSGGIASQLWNNVMDETNSSHVVVSDADLAQLKLAHSDELHHIDNVATLSVVGNAATECEQAMLATLAGEGIVVHKVQHLPQCLCLLVAESDHKRAVKLLHAQFVVAGLSEHEPELLAVS
ncbi:aspartate kinase [Thaumasiovibrio subtropicus]|uniref:aspartate kinase n=1 Tax=Thaumasiovibrio subtropicus TaxID=1891207 RepID=UPI000B36252E|nr:aspartate kinase [Thaumasiovibrio subtropicus]